MAHRAGTGDAPIPGLITSRRNPAYRLKPRPKAPELPGMPQEVRVSKRSKEERRRSPSPVNKRLRAPSPPKRDVEEEERARRRAEREVAEQARQDQEKKDNEDRKRADQEEIKKRWQDQEAKWAEERKNREAQRKIEEQRQSQRKDKLKGAFATGSDDEDDDHQRARELAEAQRRRAAAAAASTPTILAGPGASGSTLGAATTMAIAPLSGRPAVDEDADPIRLRAALADPTAARSFAPGEVAEHFRRLSEMKRRFRRAEFGGPDRSVRREIERDVSREKSRSRSRSRGRDGNKDKYNSVWIKSKR